MIYGVVRRVEVTEAKSQMGLEACLLLSQVIDWTRS